MNGGYTFQVSYEFLSLFNATSCTQVMLNGIASWSVCAFHAAGVKVIVKPHYSNRPFCGCCTTNSASAAC